MHMSRMVQRFFACRMMIGALLMGSSTFSSFAQISTSPDHVYFPNIKTVKVNMNGNPLSYPILSLNGGESLELSFDDLDGDIKNYYYTLVLCNADWTPSTLNRFDYIRGFPENRITEYRLSTIPLKKYTHYRAQFPDKNFYPIRSGNYLLKVYLDSDTAQLAFTHRVLVVDNKTQLSGVIQQPLNPSIFRTHQKINFKIGTQGLNINNPFDQIKVYILQNNRWDNAISGIKPLFVKGDLLEYNVENDCEFPAGKEWRWLDLRSFRLQTERVEKVDYKRTSTDVYVLPDYARVNTKYQYRKDINGQYLPDVLDNYNRDYEGDYATVHFSFPASEPFAGSALYLFGELTNYECTDDNRLTYNPDKKAYEGSLLLKQGYYNYLYGLVDRGGNKLITDVTEGDYWETENNYTILVYYRPLGGRVDELVGILTLNSLQNRN